MRVRKKTTRQLCAQHPMLCGIQGERLCALITREHHYLNKKKRTILPSCLQLCAWDPALCGTQGKRLRALITWEHHHTQYLFLCFFSNISPFLKDLNSGQLLIMNDWDDTSMFSYSISPMLENVRTVHTGPCAARNPRGADQQLHPQHAPAAKHQQVSLMVYAF